MDILQTRQLLKGIIQLLTWFDTPKTLQGALGSAEGKATTADLGNFATAGVKVLVGTVG